MKKTILKITAIATFALLMAFNVTTTMNSTDFSLGGLKALASGTTSGDESHTCTGQDCESCSFVRNSDNEITGCDCDSVLGLCNHSISE